MTVARISQQQIRTGKLEPDGEHLYAVTWLPTFENRPRCLVIFDVLRQASITPGLPACLGACMAQRCSYDGVHLTARAVLLGWYWLWKSLASDSGVKSAKRRTPRIGGSASRRCGDGGVLPMMAR